ncbi:twin-arginine translocation signal domain-containing protein [Paracoccus sp. YIM 132242]|uniref:Twin-arginine translocation signal domain-containing protein n=2 Tax=Paracoccus lichenicola TaxID=2665644 RepID=A0A6L6HS93_9RHOB|nr:twin-arginine translocation signal domain-containing protein [Paracoccus lichenicola]
MTMTTVSRRGFLQTSAAGAGMGTLALGLGTAPALAQTAGRAIGTGQTPPADPLERGAAGRPEPELDAAPRPTPPENRLGWAVCGLGHFAQNHAIPAIGQASEATLTGLISGNRDKALAVGAAWGVPEGAIFDYGMQGLADNDAIDIVYVITPNAIHEENVVAALEAGKHVLCEKPFAHNSAAAQRMIDAAKAADRKIMIAYRAHFEPNNTALKEMVDKGELGEIWYATSDHHRPLDPGVERDQWRMVRDLAGGGSMMDIGIYSLNGLIWLLDEVPSRLIAATFSPETPDGRFGEVEAIAQVQLVFPSGRRAGISSGYVASKKRIDLWGSQGVAVLDPATEYSGNRLTVTTAQGQEIPKPSGPSERQFTGQIDHFSKAVRDGTPILTPADMGLRDMHLLEAVYLSAERGEWVDLNPDGTPVSAR